MPLELHIAESPQGRDDNPGTCERPLATLSAARDMLRAARRDGQIPGDGASVTVHGGTYPLDESFVLTEEDSGSPGGPIVFRAAEGAVVRIIGGRSVPPSAFGPVADAGVLARLSPPARANVVQVDLRAQGITDFGTLASRGFSRATTPSHLELFVGDAPMTVAQWPNVGQFATITGYPKPELDEWGGETGSLTGGFMYESDRPRGWAASDDIWVHGYWSWDWANSYERVSRLSADEGIVETAEPYGQYSFRKGQRFYFLNVLEELDQPGEYYVDRHSGTLYLWPPTPMEGVESLVSLLATPLASLNDVSHVEFRNLVFEGGRGCGIEAAGGTGLVIAGCVVRNCGTWAIRIDGGNGHTIGGCDIYGTGDGGIDIKGGDRHTLIPCDHAVVNNHIHHFARWSRCYVAGVNAGGVGMRIANNLIHDAPHNAILFTGNEFAIEGNEIYRVCLETGDAGAIYTGRDYTFRGNSILRNFVHHMGGMGMGSIAIYMDDCVSGAHIAGNILQECMYGIMHGGGRDSVIENNVFVNCKPAVHADGRGVDPNPVWQRMVNETMRERLNDMRYHEAPYSERYPEIAGVDAHLATGKGVPPEHNRIERNICAGGTWLHDTWPPNVEKAEVKDNWVGTDGDAERDPGFTDPAFGIFSLRADSPAWAVGFTAIPVDEIGLVTDSYRPQPPPHVRAALTALVPATAGDLLPRRAQEQALAAIAEARLLLRVRNDGTTAARGTIVIDGAQVAGTGASRVEYTLRAGETAAYDLTAVTAAAAATATVVPDAEGAANGGVVQVHSPDSWMHPAKLELTGS